MNLGIICCAVAVLHALLQAWPRFFNRHFGVDCWRHMLAADHVRAHRSLPRESVENYLFRGPFDYPPALLVFLSLFSRSARLCVQAVFSPVTDALHGMLLAWLVYGWTHDATAAVTSQVLFALVPVTVLENSQLNARSPGSMFFTLTLVSVSMLHATGNAWWLAAIAVSGCLVHLTHKMASQTLVLFSVLSLPFVHRLYGMTLAAPLSLLLVFVLFPRTYTRVFKGQIAVLRYYRRAFEKAATALRSVESPSFVGRIVSLAKSNPLVTSLGADPWIVVAVFLGISGASAALPEGVRFLVLFWGAVLYGLIFVTTWVKPLRFLGDGPRYSYYLAFPIAAWAGPSLAAAWREPGSAWAWWLLPAAVAVVVVAQVILLQLKGVLGDRERSYRGDVKAIGGLLSDLDGVRVAVFPLCTAEVLAFFSGCRVLSTDSAWAHAEDDDFRDFNPRLLKPLSHFLDRYGITHCVVEHVDALADLDIPSDFTLRHDGADYRLWEREENGSAERRPPGDAVRVPGDAGGRDSVEPRKIGEC